MKSKEVKRREAIARNEQFRPQYMAEAAKKGIIDPDRVKDFADQKVGIRKMDR